MSIEIKHVVVCDACGECAIAIDKGDQRESIWTPPKDWTLGAYNSNVHFCPKCEKKLHEPAPSLTNAITYRSSEE